MAEDSAIEKLEKKGKAMVDKLFGSAKEAGDKLNKAPAKMDKEIKKQTGEEDVKSDAQGKDAGELGKKWEDTFNFNK